MSDDLQRSARQFLAELEASEAYLRVMAAQALPYHRLIAAERRAGRRCAEILATMGTFELDLVDDATDELLSGAVRPMTQPRQQVVPPPLAAPATVGAYEPFDEGPEGAADEGNDLRSEEEQVPSEIEPEETVDDEDTADGPSPLYQRTPAPAPTASASAGSFVSFDDPSEEEPAYISYDDTGMVEAEEDEPTQAPPRASSDYDSLVSFTEVDEDDEEGDDATVIVAPSDKDQAFSDVGADALVTLEETAPDLGSVLSDDDLEVLDLDEANDDIETFDLMPDLTDDSAQEDEEVTMVKAADAVLADARQGAQNVAQQRVTSGLYGGSAVPTIRDSNEPRPRAAAIQLNAGGGGGKVLGMEEEAEPIAIGAAEDYDDGEADLADGFSVALQSSDDEYDDDEYEEYDDDEYEEDDEVIEPARPPEPAGPTEAEIRAIFSKAQGAAAAGDLQGGADLYSDVIDADPDHVEAHVARGRLYLDLGDYSRAMSDFMVAEEIEANNPEPQVAIGDLYFARKDYRKAIEYFNAALEMSPNHAMAFCRRGISHYYRKNYREALDDLLRAQKVDADIPNITTYISMAKKKAKK